MTDLPNSEPFTDADARRERELQEALEKIAELEKQVKQLTMLERLAGQHATRCDANVAEADHRLAQTKAEIAWMKAAERTLYADLLDEKVALERQRQAVLDYLRTIECPNCDHPVSLHDNRLGTCSANVNNDLRPCGCDWSSSIAEDIRDLLEEQK
jgi:chromosome segregation ATPase